METITQTEQRLLRPTQPLQPKSTQDGEAVCQCNGSGFYRLDVPVGHPQFGKLIRCACKAKSDAMYTAGISKMDDYERAFRLVDIIADAGPGTAQMKAAAAAFVEQPVGLLTIWGSSGNAKTMAGQAIANECVDRGVAALYVTAFDLLEYIKEAFEDTGAVTPASRRIEFLANIRVLVIDELDKPKWTEWAEAVLTNLIDRRHRTGVSGTTGTVLIMNPMPEKFLPAWTTSRIRSGENRVILNNDPDMRPVLQRVLL